MKHHQIRFLEKNDDYIIAVADIITDFQKLSDEVIVFDSDIKRLSLISSEKKKLEFLSVRYWLQQILDYTPEIHYSEFGKPYIKNHNQSISISHSYDYISFIISKKTFTAIDLEKCSERVMKVKKRFVAQNETYPTDDISYYTFLWSCKEVVYKLHEKGNLDFVTDINIPYCNNFKSSRTAKAYILNDLALEFELQYHFIDDYVLVWCVK